MRVNGKNFTKVKCDIIDCKAEYFTYSAATKAREQAANEGWARISGREIRFEDGTILSSKKVDLCPSCKPKPRILGGAP